MNEELLKTVNDKWLILKFVEEIRARKDLKLILQLQEEIEIRMKGGKK